MDRSNFIYELFHDLFVLLVIACPGLCEQKKISIYIPILCNLRNDAAVGIQGGAGRRISFCLFTNVYRQQEQKTYNTYYSGHDTAIR